MNTMTSGLKLLELGNQVVTTRASLETIDGVHHIVATSNGRTDDGFIRHWEEHYWPSSYCKDITRRARFIPTEGVTYRIPIIMGSEFEESDRITTKIRHEAARRKYRTLPFEAACLLREAVSNQDLERLDLLQLVGMHEPIMDSDQYPYFLGVHHYGNCGVDAFNDLGNYGWGREGGFAFLAPQDQS